MMNKQEIEKLVQKAKEAYTAGDYTTAIDHFDLAYQALKETGDELLAAEMANNLSVAYIQNKQPKQALQAVLGTEKVFEAQQDITKQGMALGNIGTAYEDLGDIEKAVDYYQQSIELLDEAGETEFRSMVQKSLATIQIKKGDHLASIITMQKSLDGKKDLAPREKWLKRLLKLPFKFLGK